MTGNTAINVAKLQEQLAKSTTVYNTGSGINSGNSGSNMGNTNGNSGSNPGNSGTHYGNTGSNNGNTGTNTGNHGSNNGNSGSNLGNTGGNTGSNTGHGQSNLNTSTDDDSVSIFMFCCDFVMIFNLSPILPTLILFLINCRVFTKQKAAFCSGY